ncbi:WxL domain-containing protein [Ruoffia tabacinasalis]|uniref:WxL domain-containing protein n=1 Tax=Ruoffia tabacinasalis TaxID=87458 RepID=A0ABS0LNZ6_9LACT|nr:WxL domain-containing protein [Ruoffia tabacinasalis]MBG9979139.1 WxL domain-containing protein [Ruoffia tabacinasalis]
MKNIKKLVMSSLVGVMALSSVGVGSVGAQDNPNNETTASVTFNTGALSFTSATSTIDFGETPFTFAGVEKEGATLPNDATNFLIKLTDDRVGSELTWDLTASVASKPDNGLPKGSKITFNSGVVTSDNGLSEVNPNVNPNVVEDLVLEVGAESTPVSNADRTKKTNEGIGAWTLSYPASEMTLKLTPAQMAEISAADGKYSTTIIWTLRAVK